MMKIINIFLSACKTSFVYKKKFFLTLIGISITLVLLLTGVIFSNYSYKSDSIDNICFPINSGLYNGDIAAFPSELMMKSTKERYVENLTIDNCINKNIKVTLSGVENSYLDYPLPCINTLEYLTESGLKYGSDLSYSDIVQGIPYITLQEEYAALIFGDEYPIGKQIVINNISFYVKGILTTSSDVKRYKSSNDIENIFLYTPISIIETKFKNYKTILIFNYDSEKDLEKIPNLAYTSYHSSIKEMEEKKNSSFSKLALPLAFIIISSSIVELIIIFINLKDRYYEIGIKRAVGATKDEICFELLTENLILSTFGIVIGLIVGLILSYFTSLYYYFISYEFIGFITYREIIFSVSLVYVVSIISCLIPSIYASNANIVQIVKGE